MVLDVSCSLPNPPMQISAIASPAAMLPCVRLPASMNVSPRSPCVTAILSSALADTSVSISASARAFRLTAGGSVITPPPPKKEAPPPFFFRPGALLLTPCGPPPTPTPTGRRPRFHYHARAGQAAHLYTP